MIGIYIGITQASGEPTPVEDTKAAFEDNVIATDEDGNEMTFD